MSTGKSPRWWDEKAAQVPVNWLLAFGISVMTKYGKARELIDMLQFAAECARMEIEQNVASVFYDSKACLCVITPKDGVAVRGPVWGSIWIAAEKTLAQFDLSGDIGGYIKDSEE